MVHPNPITISLPFYVKCGVKCIGGIKKLGGIAENLTVERLWLYQKTKNVSLKMIAEYQALHDGPKVRIGLVSLR